MVAGIEASNIKAGGGLIHLKELIIHGDPIKAGFEKVMLWAPATTLKQIPDRPWLIKHTHSWLNRSLLHRWLWLKFVLPRELNTLKIQVLFTPGANNIRFSGVVSMCQNLLPFNRKESKVYGWSWMRFRIFLLYYSQLRSFYHSKRIIILTPSNKHYISHYAPELEKRCVVIAHGADERFLESFMMKSRNAKIKLLYVSIIDMYKHQWNVVDAVSELIEEGYDLELKLIGNHYPPAYKKLKRSLNLHSSSTKAITCLPAVPYEELVDIYHEADIFVFASSCETFSLVLLEAMASGLPIACADRDTLRDTLSDAGMYFNPYEVKEIKETLKGLLKSEALRKELGAKAKRKAQTYTWKECANQTFALLAEVAKENKLQG